ncbi:hypothetical protein H4217_006332, partial [Coemansia sp. RSA 1939]
MEEHMRTPTRPTIVQQKDTPQSAPARTTTAQTNANTQNYLYNSHSGGSASGGSRLKERRSITQRRGNSGLASHRQSVAGVGIYPLKSPLGENTAPVSFGNIQAVGAGDTSGSIGSSAFPLNALAHRIAEYDNSDGSRTRPSYAAGKSGRNDNSSFTFRVSDKPDGADKETAVDRQSPTVGGGIGLGATDRSDPLV